MGRHELYEELPFVAVPGLQKKEHSLSVAFSSYAAALDALETDEYLTSTTGKGLNPEEREQRLSQMSLLLLDELEADAITVTTPLIFAVLIASLLMFNGKCDRPSMSVALSCSGTNFKLAFLQLSLL